MNTIKTIFFTIVIILIFAGTVAGITIFFDKYNMDRCLELDSMYPAVQYRHYSGCYVEVADGVWIQENYLQSSYVIIDYNIVREK